MGSYDVRKCSIWNQWSIAVNNEIPPSSAATAASPTASRRDAGPPGSVKFMK